MNSYKIQDVYKLLVGEYTRIHWDKYVWSRMTVPKYRFFIWLVMKKRLQTTAKMYKIGVSENSKCLICDQDDETEDHLMFQCCFSLEVWRRIKVWLQIGPQITTAAGIVQRIAECGKTKE